MDDQEGRPKEDNPEEDRPEDHLEATVHIPLYQKPY